MNMEVIKIRPSDLQELIDKKGRSYMTAVTQKDIDALNSQKHSYTLLVDGKVALCAGIGMMWANRGEAWAIFDPACKKNFLPIHNAVKRFLEIAPITRIEAHVESGFENGHRWIRALGFKLESFDMEAVMPDGKNASLYSYVKKEGGH